MAHATPFVINKYDRSSFQQMGTGQLQYFYPQIPKQDSTLYKIPKICHDMLLIRSGIYLGGNGYIIGFSSPMTSQMSDPQTLLECPICLSALVSPISLTCGHTFCQTCIKSKYFSLVKQACPLCRKPIACELELYGVNVILEQVLMGRYGGEKVYQQRVQLSKKSIQDIEKSWLNRARKWLKQKLPWIVILILLYHLFKMKMNFYSLKFKDYKDKAIAIANSIKVENSLDFKFLLFSQFMRLLFSTIVIP